MDTSLTVKARDNVARTAVGRSNIVRTDLSPSQSVNAAQQAPVMAHAPDPLTRDPTLDPQCHAVLEREREERERRRRARKDEVLLRQRAYGRNSERLEPAPGDAEHAEPIAHTDFQV